MHFLCCILDRPKSTKVKCRNDIGRDSWVWAEQGLGIAKQNSPQELGEEALTEWSPTRRKTERPVNTIIVESYIL